MFVIIIFAYLLFNLTYSLLVLILHQERGDRLCSGSDENGREEQPRMRPSGSLGVGDGGGGYWG